MGYNLLRFCTQILYILYLYMDNCSILHSSIPPNIGLEILEARWVANLRSFFISL
jgi:hypothetical protein